MWKSCSKVCAGVSKSSRDCLYLQHTVRTCLVSSKQQATLSFKKEQTWIHCLTQVSTVTINIHFLNNKKLLQILCPDYFSSNFYSSCLFYMYSMLARKWENLLMCLCFTPGIFVYMKRIDNIRLHNQISSCKVVGPGHSDYIYWPKMGGGACLWVYMALDRDGSH